MKWVYDKQYCMLGLVGDKVYHLVLTMIIPHFTLPAASRLAEWLSVHHSADCCHYFNTCMVYVQNAS